MAETVTHESCAEAHIARDCCVGPVALAFLTIPGPPDPIPSA